MEPDEVSSIVQRWVAKRYTLRFPRLGVFDAPTDFERLVKGGNMRLTVLGSGSPEPIPRRTSSGCWLGIATQWPLFY